VTQEVFVIKQGRCHQEFHKHKQLMSSIDRKNEGMGEEANIKS